MRIAPALLVSALVFVSLPLLLSPSPAPQAPQQAAPPVQPEADGNLLLKDYAPRTKLEVHRTVVERARFPVIDIHFHMDAGADPREVAQTMNTLNLQTVVNLGMGANRGEVLQSYVTKWVKPYPGRFAVMANLDAALVN